MRPRLIRFRWKGWGWGFSLHFGNRNPVLAYSRGPTERLLMVGSRILIRRPASRSVTEEGRT